jgi:hypothetical protein
LATFTVVVVIGILGVAGTLLQYGKDKAAAPIVVAPPKPVVFITAVSLTDSIYDGTSQTPRLASVTPVGATTRIEVNPETKVGRYVATVVGTGDYQGSLNVAWKINPAPLTVIADSPSKTYDGSILAVGAPTVTGLVNGDTVTGYNNSPASVGPDVCAVTVASSVTIANGIDNYVVTYKPGVAKITGKPFKATLSDFTYDGEVKRPAIWMTDPWGATVAISGEAQTESGKYSATVTGTGNYVGCVQNVQWSIFHARPSVKLGAITRIFGGPPELFISVAVGDVNVTGSVTVGVLESGSVDLFRKSGTVIGKKTTAALVNGRATVTYEVPTSFSDHICYVQARYDGDNNHEAGVSVEYGLVQGAVPSNRAEGVVHLKCALSELRQVYFVDAKSASGVGFKALLPLLAKIERGRGDETTLFEAREQYPVVKPDMDHLMNALTILKNLIKASSQNPAVLGECHADLAISNEAIEFSLLYCGITRDVMEQKSADTSLGCWYLERSPDLSRQLTATIGKMLEALSRRGQSAVDAREDKGDNGNRK